MNRFSVGADRVIEAMYLGRGLPLLSNVVRFYNHTGAVVVEVVAKSGTPSDGAYIVTVSGTTAVARNISNGTKNSATISAGGTNSDDLIPGLDLTFPNPLVNGEFIVTVSRFGDPKVDQQFSFWENTATGTVTTASKVFTPGSDGIPMGAAKLVVTDLGWSRETGVAHSNAFNMRFTFTHDSAVKGFRTCGTTYTDMDQYDINWAFDLTVSDLTVSLLWNASAWHQWFVRGWYE